MLNHLHVNWTGTVDSIVICLLSCQMLDVLSSPHDGHSLSCGGLTVSFPPFDSALKCEEEGQVFFSLDDGATKFTDLIHLVEFYQLNRGVLPCKLKHPCTAVALWHCTHPTPTPPFPSSLHTSLSSSPLYPFPYQCSGFEKMEKSCILFWRCDQLCRSWRWRFDVPSGPRLPPPHCCLDVWMRAVGTSQV